MNFAKKTVAVIFNPKGGTANAQAVAELKAALAAQGISLVTYTTTAAPGSARDLARRAASGADGVYDLVIACGGDGTVCQVAEGLIGSATPLAVLPAGTGNLFARAFYARPDAAKLVDTIVSGKPQPIDMIKLEYTGMDCQEHEQLYLVALGLGKMSDAISGASAEMKRRFGTLTYVVRMLKAAFSPAPVKYTFTPQGSAAFTTKAAVVFAVNAVPPAMGTLSRGCNASDGLVDLVVFKATGLPSLLALAWQFILGRPDLSKHYVRCRTGSVRIECDRPVSPNIDGDPGALTCSMLVTTLPAAVNVLVC